MFGVIAVNRNWNKNNSFLTSKYSDVSRLYTTKRSHEKLQHGQTDRLTCRRCRSVLKLSTCPAYSGRMDQRSQTINLACAQNNQLWRSFSFWTCLTPRWSTVCSPSGITTYSLFYFFFLLLHTFPSSHCKACVSLHSSFLSFVPPFFLFPYLSISAAIVLNH